MHDTCRCDGLHQGGVRWVGGQEKHHNFLNLGQTGWNDPPGGPVSQSAARDRPGTSDREFESICHSVERDLGRAAPEPDISHRTGVVCPCICTVTVHSTHEAHDTPRASDTHVTGTFWGCEGAKVALSHCEPPSTSSHGAVTVRNSNDSVICDISQWGIHLHA